MNPKLRKWSILVAMLLCVLSPYLAKVPHGWLKVLNYCPNEPGFVVLVAFFSAFPGIAFLLFSESNPNNSKNELPLILAISGGVGLMYYAHFTNRVSNDAQDSVAFLVIPIYALGLSIIAGFTGLVISWLRVILRRWRS